MLERRRQAWAYRGLKPETDRENLKGGRPQIWGSVLHGPQWSWRVSSTCEFSGDAISYRRVPQASTDLSWDHLREPQYSKYSNNVINVVSFDSYTGLRDNGKHSHCATDMKLNFHHSTELRKKPQWSKALGSRSVWYHYPVCPNICSLNEYLLCVQQKPVGPYTSWPQSLKVFSGLSV